MVEFAYDSIEDYIKIFMSRFSTLGVFDSNKQRSGRTSEEDKHSSMYFHAF